MGGNISFYYKKKNCFEINGFGGGCVFYIFLFFCFFFNITKMNYIGEKIGQTEGDKHTCTHARTHFQIKIQAIKRPSKHSLFLYWFTQK